MEVLSTVTPLFEKLTCRKSIGPDLILPPCLPLKHLSALLHPPSAQSLIICLPLAHPSVLTSATSAPLPSQ
ncbi:unnamed protein product [Merluccius merluccius]